MNEFGNSKLFELYFIFYATAMVLPRHFRHRGSTGALPADDLADYMQVLVHTLWTGKCTTTYLHKLSRIPFYKANSYSLLTFNHDHFWHLLM